MVYQDQLMKTNNETGLKTVFNSAFINIQKYIKYLFIAEACTLEREKNLQLKFSNQFNFCFHADKQNQ
jgi:hypothetical protein